MAKKPLRVGLIGCGFMGRTHSNAYHVVNKFFDLEVEPVLKTVCSIDKAAAESFASNWGYENAETDWRKVVESDDIDIIDICLPNNLHPEVAIAAAEAGKAILCEKPLAHTLERAEAMTEAVEKAGVPNLVSFNYRRLPAVTMAKQLVDEGRLGKIFHYRANFLQDWTISDDVPQGGDATWRLDAKVAGSGVTGDLLAHCIDSAMWHNGVITKVQAVTETFIKERKHAETGKVEPVTIDDACIFHCYFDNGSLGSFESTRYARGHKALYTFEINGEHASIAWDLHDLNRLSWFDHNVEGKLRGWSSIHVTDHGGDQPYMSNWWVPGLSIGYAESFVHQLFEYLTAMAKGEKGSPDFREALQTQYVCESVLKSAKTGQWEGVKQA